MWAAGDDRWSPRFVARSVAHLNANPEALLAVPQVEFSDAASGRTWLAPGTFALQGTWSQRVAAVFACPPKGRHWRAA